MSESWYRGVIVVKNAGNNDVQMIKQTGKAYNRPGPAKAWVTINRKRYPRKRDGRTHTVYASYIEKATGWKRVEEDS